MNTTQTNTVKENKIYTNKSSLEEDMDEIYFNTRERSHKKALRAWLYKNDGSIPQQSMIQTQTKVSENP
jgi:hypothetical protein